MKRRFGRRNQSEIAGLLVGYPRGKNVGQNWRLRFTKLFVSSIMSNWVSGSKRSNSDSHFTTQEHPETLHWSKLPQWRRRKRRECSINIEIENATVHEHEMVLVSQKSRLGSSGIPLFCTEDSDAPTLDQGDRKERKRWSKAEDIVLISAWLNTSKDSVVSNEQKNSAFWNRIAAVYNGIPSIAAAQKREMNNCKQRWRKINYQVSKFCGAYSAANSPPKSGWTDKNYVKLAHEIFLSDYKVKFMLEHAWNELKNEQKWCYISSSKGVQGGSSKRRKTSDGGAQSGSSQSVTNLEDGFAQPVEVRPPGVKAIKAKLKRSVNNTTSEVEQGAKLENIKTVWEIKQKDAAIKAKQS